MSFPPTPRKRIICPDNNSIYLIKWKVIDNYRCEAFLP